jgi:hypothetical protein
MAIHEFNNGSSLKRIAKMLSKKRGQMDGGGSEDAGPMEVEGQDEGGEITDTDRINWLQENGFGAGGWVVQEIFHGRSEDLRSAIDKAMNGGEKEGNRDFVPESDRKPSPAFDDY